MTPSMIPFDKVQIDALIARGMLNAEPDDSPSSYAAARLAEHVGAAGLWSELANRPYLLDALEPDSVAVSVLRTAYGLAGLPPTIAASLSARHLLNELDVQDRLMTRWVAAACGTGLTGDSPAWAMIRDREPPHVVLTGHRGAVNSVTVLHGAEGPAIASAGLDSTIRIWDPLTGRPARADIEVGEVPLTAVEALPFGGGALAGIGNDGDVRVWNWRTGTLAASSGGAGRSERALLALLHSHRGALICSGQVRGRLTLRRYGPDGLAEVGSIVVPGGVRAIASTSFGGSWGLLTGGDDGRVRLYRGELRESAAVLLAGGGVSGLQVAESLDGTTLILALTDSGRVIVLRIDASGLLPTDIASLETGEAGRPITLVSDPATGIEVIAAGEMSGLVQLWRRTEINWQLGAAMAGHTGAVYALATVAVTDGRRLLVSAGADGTIRLWRPDASPTSDSAGLDRITAVATMASGGIAVGTANGSVRLVDIHTGRLDDGMRIESSRAVHAITEVGDIGDASILATGGAERGVRMWNVRTGRSVTDRLARHQSTIRQLVVYRNRSGAHRVASGADDGVVRLWNPVTGRRVGNPLVGYGGAIQHLAAGTADGASVLVGAGDDGTFIVWREADPDQFEVSRWAMESPVVGLVVASDGLITVACVGGDVEIRDPSGGLRSRLRFSSFAPIVSATLVQLARGDFLALGTSSGSVQLIEIATQEIIRTTLLPMRLVARGLWFISGRLLALTDQGLLCWMLDPRIEITHLARSERFHKGSLGP